MAERSFGQVADRPEVELQEQAKMTIEFFAKPEALLLVNTTSRQVQVGDL